MKFTDGYWLMRDGVRARYPVELVDAVAVNGKLRVYAATRRVRHRGDTLNEPLVTIECQAPMDDVIGVRIIHHAGEKPRTPSFELEIDPSTHVEIATAGDEVSITSGALRLDIEPRDPFALRFRAGGRLLTSSEYKATALLETSEGRHYVREQLALGVDEHVYGLGERFGPLVKNGQTIDIWNADGGTSSEQAYKNVPFFVSDKGYGVFVNHPDLVSFEIGSEVVSRTQFSVEGQAMEYFLIYGPSPKDVLRKYTALTGRPALPPAWSFGLWLSTSFTTSYDEATVNAFVDGMMARDLPLSVVHFDTFWMKEYHWCDFEWDPRVFPDPRGMLERLKAKGLHVCVWINPYIAQQSSLFEEGMRQGFLLRRPNGDVWQWDRWQPGMALVDFTNPAACDWYSDKLRSLLNMGVDCFKSDFGERVPTDVVYHDGSDPERMHNYYAFLYNRTVFEVLEKARGVGEAVLFARSATVGGQRFPVHWGGDCSATYESMAESLRGGLSLAASGFGYWSHDIGGFEGTPESAVFKRWVPFGLLSSHSRLHGNESYRVPWAFDDESVDVLRLFTKLKLRLMPYLFQAAVVAHEQGIPMIRPMTLEFADDPGCAYLDRQYMLGDSLLVSPVFSEEGNTTYYVPEGRWTRLQTGAVTEGPRWVRESCGFSEIPLLVRPNTVLPLGAYDDRPDYAYADGVTLALFQIDCGAEVEVVIPTLSGERDCTFTATRTDDAIVVRRSGPPAAWNVLVVGAYDATPPARAAQFHELGTLVAMQPEDLECTLRLA